MSNVDTAAELAKIRRATFFVRGRLRLARAIGITPVVVPVSVLFLAIILAAHKVDPLWLPAPAAMAGSAVVIGGAALVWLVALLWPLPPNIGPLLLDKAHNLDGRLTNALEFAAIPKSERTPLMQAAIDEACGYVADRPRARTLRTGVAAPLFGGLVVSWWMFLALLAPSAAMLGLVVAFEVRVPAPPPVVEVKGPTPPELVTPDDLDAFRDAAKELEKREQSPEMRAALDRFNRLIEDIAEKKLDRNEALREMEALEREMLAGSQEDDKKLADELKESAKQLDKADLAKELAESLKKNERKKAEKNLKDLAKKLRENCVDPDLVAKDEVTLLDLVRVALLVPSDEMALRGGLGQMFASIFDGKEKAPIVKGKPCAKKPNKEQLKKLADALKKAVEKRKEALAAVNEKRAEMQEQLLKKKKQIAEEKDPQKKEEQENLLKKQERELQRLDRESQKQAAANRQLEKLDRELSQAAQDLLKDLGISPEDLQQAAEALEKAAEDMNRMDQESMTEKEKQELKKKLEELREIIRQQKGDKKRQSRMVKFSKRARGGQPKAGKQGQQGEDGDEGDEGEEGDQGDDGKNGKGKKGQGQGDGEEGEDGAGGKGKKGKKGQGQGDGDDIEITIGPGGVPIPVPGQGGPGDKPGDGSGNGGKDAGTGAGGPVAGDPTTGKVGTNNVNQEGLETNQGPTDSQIISAAAEKGFRGHAYEKTFRDYRTHAEENINKEDIPDGYRAYIRRYFQLIRPRD
ncbi:MAG: hypothetical protein JNK04_14070 [Myxococcales bacterium]|nr:hypothetical protein [Myxococcales bacterium]